MNYKAVRNVLSVAVALAHIGGNLEIASAGPVLITPDAWEAPSSELDAPEENFCDKPTMSYQQILAELQTGDIYPTYLESDGEPSIVDFIELADCDNKNKPAFSEQVAGVGSIIKNALKKLCDLGTPGHVHPHAPHGKPGLPDGLHIPDHINPPNPHDIEILPEGTVKIKLPDDSGFKYWDPNRPNHVRTRKWDSGDPNISPDKFTDTFDEFFPGTDKLKRSIKKQNDWPNKEIKIEKDFNGDIQEYLETKYYMDPDGNLHEVLVKKDTYEYFSPDILKKQVTITGDGKEVEVWFDKNTGLPIKKKTTKPSGSVEIEDVLPPDVDGVVKKIITHNDGSKDITELIPTNGGGYKPSKKYKLDPSGNIVGEPTTCP